MRDALVDRHLQHLRVDHQQAHVARLGLVQQRQDHRVDAHRLACARGARHQAVRHLREVGHHRRADDVLAEAHGELRRGVVVDLRAEDLRQADHLPLGVRQLERHRRLAGDRLDHADAHQAQRARQVLREVDDLRALHAGGRLDLVARDDRAGRGGHHAHLDAEVLQLLLDEARGHLERLGRHRLHAAGSGVEQVDLRQLGVGQLAEERLLALLHHALALRHLHHRRLDHDGHVVLEQLVLHLGLLLALAQRLLAETDVLGALDTLDAPFAQRLDPGADALGDAHPREAEPHREAGHQHGDPQHAGAREAEAALRQRAQQVAEHASGVAAGQAAFPLVHAAPFERGAGAHQQHDTDPEEPARLARVLGVVAAQHACEPTEPFAPADRHQPPRRIAEEEEREIGEPGAQRAGRVVQHRRAAGGGERRVGGVVRGHREQRQQPQHAAGEQLELQLPVRMVRGAGGAGRAVAAGVGAALRGSRRGGRASGV